jgi:hypothetical protein
LLENSTKNELELCAICAARSLKEKQRKCLIEKDFFMLKFLAAACGKRLMSEKGALWRELPTKLSTRQ